MEPVVPIKKEEVKEIKVKALDGVDNSERSCSGKICTFYASIYEFMLSGTGIPLGITMLSFPFSKYPPRDQETIKQTASVIYIANDICNPLTCIPIALNLFGILEAIMGIAFLANLVLFQFKDSEEQDFTKPFTVPNYDWHIPCGGNKEQLLEHEEWGTLSPEQCKKVRNICLYHTGRGIVSTLGLGAIFYFPDFLMTMVRAAKLFKSIIYHQ